MTKSEADAQDGRDLIDLILRICHDGKLDIHEVEELHIFLRRCHHPMNAIPFLRAITREIVADGVVDENEAYALKRACERVVPKEIREVVATHLMNIGLPTSIGEREPVWRSHAATSAQIEYITNLGGSIKYGLTKGEASDLIEQLLDRRPVTPRQKMLLRFFNRLDLMNATKEDVSRWIDSHFLADERHERVWTRYKIETNQDPQSLDFECVPIGLGNKWLGEMSNASISSPRQVVVVRDDPKKASILLLSAVAVGVLVIIVLFFAALR